MKEPDHSVSPLWPRVLPADVQSTSWKDRTDQWLSVQNRVRHKSSAGSGVLATSRSFPVHLPVLTHSTHGARPTFFNYLFPDKRAEVPSFEMLSSCFVSCLYSVFGFTV